MASYQLIVMGVSGCGKSTVAELLATKLGYSYYDGDDYHPKENIEKMQKGNPLSDADRQGWLGILNDILQKHEEGTVIACSALKKSYREKLTQKLTNPIFVYLQGDFETIWVRHQQRANHYFQGKKMLESQYEILEEPDEDNVITVDVEKLPEKIVQEVFEQLNNKF